MNHNEIITQPKTYSLLYYIIVALNISKCIVYQFDVNIKWLVHNYLKWDFNSAP
jgi:hypothetical protein